MYTKRLHRRPSPHLHSNMTGESSESGARSHDEQDSDSDYTDIKVPPFTGVHSTVDRGPLGLMKIEFTEIKELIHQYRLRLQYEQSLRVLSAEGEEIQRTEDSQNVLKEHTKRIKNFLTILDATRSLAKTNEFKILIQHNLRSLRDVVNKEIKLLHAETRKQYYNKTGADFTLGGTKYKGTITVKRDDRDTLVTIEGKYNNLDRSNADIKYELIFKSISSDDDTEYIINSASDIISIEKGDTTDKNIKKNLRMKGNGDLINVQCQGEKVIAASAFYQSGKRRCGLLIRTLSEHDVAHQEKEEIHIFEKPFEKPGKEGDNWTMNDYMGSNGKVTAICFVRSDHPQRFCIQYSYPIPSTAARERKTVCSLGSVTCVKVMENNRVVYTRIADDSKIHVHSPTEPSFDIPLTGLTYTLSNIINGNRDAIALGVYETNNVNVCTIIYPESKDRSPVRIPLRGIQDHQITAIQCFQQSIFPSKLFCIAGTTSILHTKRKSKNLYLFEINLEQKESYFRDAMPINVEAPDKYIRSITIPKRNTLPGFGIVARVPSGNLIHVRVTSKYELKLVETIDPSLQFSAANSRSLFLLGAGPNDSKVVLAARQYDFIANIMHKPGGMAWDVSTNSGKRNPTLLPADAKSRSVVSKLEDLEGKKIKGTIHTDAKKYTAVKVNSIQGIQKNSIEGTLFQLGKQYAKEQGTIDSKNFSLERPRSWAYLLPQSQKAIPKTQGQQADTMQVTQASTWGPHISLDTRRHGKDNGKTVTMIIGKPHVYVSKNSNKVWIVLKINDQNYIPKKPRTGDPPELHLSCVEGTRDIDKRK